MEFNTAKYCSSAQTVLCCNNTIYNTICAQPKQYENVTNNISDNCSVFRSRSKCYYGNIFIAERDSVQSHLSTLYKNPGDQVQVIQ